MDSCGKCLQLLKIFLGKVVKWKNIHMHWNNEFIIFFCCNASSQKQLRLILIDVQAINEKSDISLIGLVTLNQNEILQETCDLSEDHQLFLITFKAGCKS